MIKKYFNLQWDSQLLFVDFIQDGSQRWYGFIRDAMFADIDTVCEQYDFSDEHLEPELTTVSEATKLSVCDRQFEGSRYLVTENYCGDITIYRIMEVSNED